MLCYRSSSSWVLGLVCLGPEKALHPQERESPCGNPCNLWVEGVRPPFPPGLPVSEGRRSLSQNFPSVPNFGTPLHKAFLARGKSPWPFQNNRLKNVISRFRESATQWDLSSTHSTATQHRTFANAKPSWSLHRCPSSIANFSLQFWGVLCRKMPDHPV